MDEWTLIFLMAAVTYLPRYLPFALAGRVRLPAALARALDYVPIAVLTAIITQSALFRGGELELGLHNSHAVSAAAAFTAALLWRNLFVTVGVGLACFVLLKVFL